MHHMGVSPEDYSPEGLESGLRALVAMGLVVLLAAVLGVGYTAALIAKWLCRVLARPFEELEVPDEHGLQPVAVRRFAAVSPAPPSVPLRLGQVGERHSLISNPRNFFVNCARTTGVNPLRVRAA